MDKTTFAKACIAEQESVKRDARELKTLEIANAALEQAREENRIELRIAKDRSPDSCTSCCNLTVDARLLTRVTLKVGRRA